MRNKVIYIGIDDTDTLGSRGTGHLARVIAADLAGSYPVAGVTRHQLLFDPRIPYTAKNSCAAIHLEAQTDDLPSLFARVKAIMMTHFETGSDPGLAVTSDIPQEITTFGKRAKTEVLYQIDALALAQKHNILIEGLGGTNDGVIGALSAIGLAAEGNDGRYIQVGTVRELAGMVPSAALISTGIQAVRQVNGKAVTGGLLMAEKLRPARRGGLPVQFVERGENSWLPLKLD